MQAVRRSTPITDEVESQLSIAPLDTLVNLPSRNLRFSHHNLEMVDQGFHFGIHIRFRRKVVCWCISMVNISSVPLNACTFW